jgi:hypothetical protein
MTLEAVGSVGIMITVKTGRFKLRISSVIRGAPR